MVTYHRTIGLFGGTFDPPHLGHLVAAEYVRDTLGLDEVRLVVANDPWQKSGERSITDARLRLDMVRAAVADVPGLVVSDVELRLGGASHTAATLQHLSVTEPDARWLVIVGADAAAGLDTWNDAERLQSMSEIVVVQRPGERGRPPAGWRWSEVHIPPIGVSSSEVRARVAQGRTVRFIVPDPVRDLVERWGLYRSES